MVTYSQCTVDHRTGLHRKFPYRNDILNLDKDCLLYCVGQVVNNNKISISTESFDLPSYKWYAGYWYYIFYTITGHHIPSTLLKVILT